MSRTDRHSLRLLDGTPPVPEGESKTINVLGDQTDVVKDPTTGAVKIEHEDGSVTIDVSGRTAPRKRPEDNEHYENLAEEIAADELSRIAQYLIQAIGDDDRSRSEWLDTRAKGIDLLGLKIEDPKGDSGTSSAPVEGMSTVRHPMLLEAVIAFQSTSRGELLPSGGPVKVRVDGKKSSGVDKQAEALENGMNHYLTVVDKRYVPDTDRTLFMTGFGGCQFKKIFFDPLKRRPSSESVDAKDLIVSNAAVELEESGRITHVINMRPAVLKRMQLCGAYLDVPLTSPPFQQTDVVDKKIAEVQGVSPTQSPTRPEDRDRTIYECYCELDIKGYEHKDGNEETGLPLPYKVTIEKDSQVVLEVRRNWKEDDEDFNAQTVFVKYPFIPGLGFYDIGLVHILGNSTTALTAAWREMLDTGMFANFPGFLYAKELGRQETTEFRIAPGSGKGIDTGGLPIREAVMELPYKDVGAGLLGFANKIEERSDRLAGTTQIQTGEGRQDAPVGTTIALIEQATKPMSAVHKRLCVAQSEEFQLLKDLFKEYPESLIEHLEGEWDEEKLLTALERYDIVPAADPNTPSHVHRIMKCVAVKELQAQHPELYDARKVDEKILNVMGWQDPEDFFAAPQPPEQPPVDLAALAKIMDIQVKQGKLKLEDKKIMLDAATAISDALEARAKRKTDEDIAILQLATTLAIHPEAEDAAGRGLAIGRQSATEGEDNGTR